MSPKEKALELYKKYEFVYIQNYTSKHEVKQCALIAVELRLEGYFAFSSIEYGEDSIEYWEQVKTELERL